MNQFQCLVLIIIALTFQARNPTVVFLLTAVESFKWTLGVSSLNFIIYLRVRLEESPKVRKLDGDQVLSGT